MALGSMKSAGRKIGAAGGSRPQVSVRPARVNTVTRATLAVAPPTTPLKRSNPIILNGQVLHSLSEERLDIVRSMGPFLQEHVAHLLTPVDKIWQPYDFLPRAEDPDFEDQVRELRKRTSNLPDDYLVVFVGDMITEEALPTYMTMINGLDGVRDETGASPTPWANWTRAWVAEENRHGDAMNKYMWLTGRVNIRAVEITVQNLIRSGMDPKTENNPYLGFVYTSFQERATKVSHGNTARAALEYGDKTLAKLSGIIASDEARHEQAYQRIIEHLLEVDPSGAMTAYGDMMKKQIVMPAHLMDDNEHSKQKRNLFADFSSVAEKIGAYNAWDYADIMDYLNKRWKVEERTGLTGEAAEAQEFVLKMPARIRKLAERQEARKKKGTTADFSWVFNRTVTLH